MSLKSLMIHKIDVRRHTETRGGAAGQIRTDSTIKTLMGRVQPLSARRRFELGTVGSVITHRVYFAEDPGIEDDDWLEYDDDGTTLRLKIEGEAFDTDMLHRLYVVDCRRLTDTGD